MLFFFGPSAVGWLPFSWTSAGIRGVFCGFSFFFLYAGYRQNVYGSCGEIRLGDDGTCEFETKRSVIRLHVNDLRSVRYSRETSENAESYTIHYRAGELRVTKRMTDFGDFLTRLKALNPAVDLTSFPADAWPSLGQPATQERGSLIRRSVGNALFPLIILVVLAWVAINTLAGNSP